MTKIDLSGKTALVAGVANHRSLAWAIGKELGDAGARLVLTYQSERFADAAAKLAAEYPGSLLVECDVASDASLDAAFARISAEAGRVDVLVHAIAFANREDLEGAFVDTSREGYRVALEISAFSLLALTSRAAPLMTEGGAIVSLSFIAAQRALANYNVMGTAKAALEQSTRLLAQELGPRKIRVNCISAGPVNTLSARGISGFTGMLGIHADRAPLKRNVTPKEVGTTALFLCSDLSSGITGDVIYVDAGFHVTI